MPIPTSMETNRPYGHFYHRLIAIAVLVNFSGICLTILGPDGDRYASIAKTMALHHDYVNLFSDGGDWLDKPHFPFWLTAISFRLFGIHTWSYKLPGILLLLLGAVYTYRFGKKLYNREAGLLATLILLTAEHIVLSNNDVRAEPFLTGLIIAATFHYYEVLQRNGWKHLLLASFFAACAVMTKGLFALIPVGGAIAGHLLIRRDWKALFHPRWLVSALLILVFILPELYTLYVQFDRHPEKLVWGERHVSGLKFFFWDSQFGRFFNTGPIKGSGDPLFFVHTLLWAFLPWSLLLYAAIGKSFGRAVRRASGQEWYCLCGALLTFLVFSVSRFQLSYYLNIVFPFFSILLAAYLYRMASERTTRTMRLVQAFVLFVLVAGVLVLHAVYQPGRTMVLALLLLLLLASLAFRKSFAPDLKMQVIFSTAAAAFFLNLYLNFVFYPSLLRYQAGSEAAAWINRNRPQDQPVYANLSSFSLEFYLNRPVQFVDTAQRSYPRGSLFFLPGEETKELSAKGWHFNRLKTFEDFPVSRLNGRFLQPGTRHLVLRQMEVLVLDSLDQTAAGGQ